MIAGPTRSLSEPLIRQTLLDQDRLDKITVPVKPR
jgi:hypothetical protein